MGNTATVARFFEDLEELGKIEKGKEFSENNTDCEEE
jgi:hypothetical protein